MDSENQYPLFDSAEILSKYDNNGLIRSYLDEVYTFNKKVNIVSRETSPSDLIRLAADCLIPLELGHNINGYIFDIGPGAGFPSIVLMLANPSITGVLIERTGKKARFLMDIIRKFNLRGVVHDKNLAEIAPLLTQQSFDYGLMKYVRLDRGFLKVILSLLMTNGKFLYYSRLNEVNDSENDIYNVFEENYYLDDIKQFRTLSIFSQKR